MNRYALHGMGVDSEIPLHAWQRERGPADVTVRWTGGRLDEGDPVGEEVCAISTEQGRRQLSIVRHDEGHTLRYHGLAEITVDTLLTTMHVRAPEGTPADLLATIVSSGAFGLVLSLLQADAPAPEVTLHASAVEYEGRAVAFVGPSGAGKSTCAALAVNAGASLVADDVLRVALRDGGAVCFHGVRSVRLRAGAAGIANHGRWTTAATSDDRVAATPVTDHEPTDALAPVELAAVVVTSCSGASQPALRRLDPAEGVVQLLPHARTHLARTPGTEHAHLRGCSTLARIVPLLELTLTRPRVDGAFADVPLEEILERAARSAPAAMAR